MNIVVVDDEPTIVQMCLKVLGEQGHTVQGFSSTRAALAPPASPRARSRARWRSPELPPRHPTPAPPGKGVASPGVAFPDTKLPAHMDPGARKSFKLVE